ncbi:MULTISPECIES: hypothetical protein [Bacillus cereus group]|uniref:Uncharacterized protein n=1 Tax=Bacillus cereus TaxID=1396 RepID=A0A161TH56_BACCE|nr:MULTISPECIES: hypothetical protein [Bacillus cereus group]KZD41630.1 hypothetical protein B4082_0265 [Bacillus cereus]PRT29890.1 hypothetical protein C6351_10210 [Bacillus thuringiensis]QWG59950.1 hypothetical protein EXW60_02175 [Bacillus mycoides]QWJ04915.1 hypothetical protein J5V76_18430 [Bacillus mycoides]
MINQLREKLWKTIYLNPLYPNDLLENAKDPDYHGVNFSAYKGGTKVDLVFQDLGQIIKATYYFDSKDFLQKAVMYEFEKESIIYDRNLEIQSIIDKIKTVAPQEEIFVAI